jgi:hypothetical protein
MPYFHVTAVFEVNGTSLEDADRTAGALFRSFRHRRVHYYEHDVTAGAATSSSRALHFSVIAEFDVDAGSEERAGEMTEEALEALATDEVQFIAFGLTQGEQRVRPAERPEREEAESGRQQETRGEGDEDEERQGKKRSPRGRGRRRKNEREPERVHEETAEVAAFAPESDDSFQEKTDQETPAREERVEAVTEAAAPIAAPFTESLPPAGPAPTQVEVREEVPSEPPPRSSASMRVTLTMSFRARELGFQANGVGALDQDEFLSRAIAEARARHPELPVEAAPTHEIVVRPWGESVLTLTWAYDVPVPSASEDAS